MTEIHPGSRLEQPGDQVTQQRPDNSRGVTTLHRFPVTSESSQSEVRRTTPELGSAFATAICIVVMRIGASAHRRIGVILPKSTNPRSFLRRHAD
jgi:hypothetical protein